MADPVSVYPDAIDGFAQIPLAVDRVTPVDAASINGHRSAIISIEEELGTNPSGSYSTLTDRLAAIEGGVIAENVSFDSDNSILSSDNVQDAIDELASINIVSVSTSYVAQSEDAVILVDASGGAAIIGLPTAADFQHLQRVKKTDTSNNIVTITPLPGQTIDGSSSGVIINAPHDSYTFVNDGSSAWYIL